MTVKAALAACYSDWKLIKTRSVVQLIFEIPLEASGDAYQALGGMPQPGQEVWCAIARLAQKREDAIAPASAHAQRTQTKPAPVSQASPARARTWDEIMPSQQAGIRCNEPAFVKFLAGRYRRCVDSTESASQLIRELCEVQSRSEIRAGTKSAETWARIEGSYQTWLLAERVGAA